MKGNNYFNMLIIIASLFGMLFAFAGSVPRPSSSNLQSYMMAAYKFNTSCTSSDNVTIVVFDAATGGNVISNQTFIGNISNGVMTAYLNMTLATTGNIYYVERYCNNILFPYSDGSNRMSIDTMIGRNGMIIQDYGGDALRLNLQGNSIKFNRSNGASFIDQFGSGGIQFRFNGSLEQNGLFINGSAVGIGTTNPESLLHLKLTGGNTLQQILESDGYAQTAYRANVDGASHNWTIIVRGDDGTFQVREMNVSEPSANRFNILHGGNVGIGTTNPTEKLDVKGSILCNSTGAEADGIIMQGDDSDNLLVYKNVTGNTQWLTYLKEGDLIFYDRAADRIKFMQGGKVGIGTTNPTELLEVNGKNDATGSNPYSANIVLNGSTMGVNFYSPSGGQMWRIASNNGSKVFSIAEIGVGTPFAIQNKTGNVGIGTTSMGSAHVTIQNVDYATSTLWQLIVTNDSTLEKNVAHFVRDDATKRTAYFYRNYSADIISKPMVEVLDINYNSDEPALLVQNYGNASEIRIAANVSGKVCDSKNEGGIYYDGATKKHYGCNSSTWNALY